MSLLELWRAQRRQLEDKHVPQIIAIAGSGKLADGSDTSTEFRDFLSHVPSTLLGRYAEECLREKFDGSGFVLQDIVNEIGRRLGFTVESGRYRGSPGASGHDGLWSSKTGFEIVVEVKTTDTYRIDLNTLAGYRRMLTGAGRISEEKSSMLIVAGRQDTGDLEVQIRGSRYAWDMRLISVDALVRLMLLKEEVEDPRILHKISGILIPQEFTRVDGIIDLVFSAAEEIKEVAEAGIEEEREPGERGLRKPKFTPVSFHEACIDRIELQLGRSLVRQTKATFGTPDGSLMVFCAVSREHTKEGSQPGYWYAFHPHQKERLSEAKQSYVSFGRGSEMTILLIPFQDFVPWLEGLNVTQGDDRSYWHVIIFQENGRFVLRRKKGFERIDLTSYLVRANKS